MAKLSEVFTGNYLKADDLHGRTVPVTISQAEVKDFEDGKKVVVHFEGKSKALVCNKTNCSIIAENVGSDDTDNWAGAQISLTVRKVEFQGKLVPAIRVVLNETQPQPNKLASKLTNVPQQQRGFTGKVVSAEPEPESEVTEEPQDDVPF